MRSLAAFVGLALAAAMPAAAQDANGPVPERRLAMTEGVDFFGNDLRTLLDSTLSACGATCLADPACRAFTFNARSGSCFPKSGVGRRSPFEGAVSGIVLETPPEVLAQAVSRAEELGFLRRGDLDAARAQAEGLASAYAVGDLPAEEYAGAASRARLAGDAIAAVSFSGVAVVLSDAAEEWIGHAEDLLALPAGRYEAVRQQQSGALSAAVNGYLRAEAPPVRAAALAVMAQALESLDRGPESLDALRLAGSLSPREDIAEARDRAEARFGFRLVDHIVESDAPLPRICAEFSEPLAEAGVDYAPFVRLPAAGYAVEAAGNRLCIEGVRHGQRYQVTFRQALPSAEGEETAAPVTLDLYVRDRTPSVRFPGRAYVLPKSGATAVPVVTVNAESLDLVLRRVGDRNLLRAIQEDYFGRPLDRWQEDAFADGVSREVWRGTGVVERTLNEDVTTRLPLDGVLSGLTPGIYALQARVTGTDPYRAAAATQWFVVSDLGLATIGGEDGLHVFVRSLSTAAPAAGVEVTLVSRANEILGTTVTDARGHANFPPGLTRGTGGAAPALVMAEAEEDLSFLSLAGPEFDLSDRGVEGRQAPPPIDVFLATDRGAYRAGETIHLTALARDATVAAIDGLPLTAILTRPDGVEYARHLSEGSVAGGHVFALPVAPTAPRGAWRIAVHADPQAEPLATQVVLVEDFLPERIDVTLALPQVPIGLDDTPSLEVEARYLFGPPAADLAVEGSAELRAVRNLPDFPGYLFGRHDAPFEARTAYFEAGLRTDARGTAVIPVSFPEVAAPDRPLEARIAVRVSEGSGRQVERRIERLLSPAAPLIGVRPAFEAVVAENGEARFDLIAVGTDGERAALPVTWALNRVETRYQWYQLEGRWEWEPVTTRTRVSSGEAPLVVDAPFSLSVPVEWGEYELRVERADGVFAATSVAFSAGWYAPADASETPDTLAVSLDKPAYRPGETATVRIVPRYAGKGLVTVVSNRLIAMRAVDFSEGENTVSFPVTDDWGAGAYVAATILRPMDVDLGRNPARALGLAHAAVDPGDRRLQASLEVPPEAAPRAPLDVALKVGGVAEGETAWATIAAVDVGILNLTAFETPDPADHYFGQRRLGVAMRDLYGRLIDGLSGALGEVRSGGDALAEMRMEGQPPPETLVAFFSGPVEVDGEGIARTSFDLPSFNGTVRLMAVVWSHSGIGQAEAEVLVRDPVVVTASLPRFLAPGDESRLLLEFAHAAGPTGTMPLAVTAEGVSVAGSMPEAIELAEEGRAVISVPVEAAEPGAHRISVALTTPDGRELTKTLTLPVRVTDPAVARQSRFSLAPGATFAFGPDVFAGLRPGTGTATLSAGPLARLDAPGLLAALDRYPYGCTEQVASAAMPLLYFEEMARAMGLASRSAARTRVEEAIAAVLTNQAPSGSFGLWAPEPGDMWLDAYVSDFLSRARAKGYDVPATAFRSALDNLRNQVNYYPEFDRGGEDLAYALFVLAREGAAAVGDLRYYADAKGDAFATPLAAAQLAAALAAYGDPARADAMFARAEALLAGPEPDPRLWRTDYGTRLRDAAGLLALAVETGSQAVDREALAARIAGATQERSTQEALWTLLAAHALIERPDAPLSVDGVPVDGPLVRLLESGTATGSLAIRNEGATEETLTLTTFGVPAEPEPAGGNGWAIARRYYTLDGAPADPASVAAGTRLVTVLEVTPLGEREARLMVNDPLPAGFEIDNPNLMRAGDIRALDWLEPAEARHAEFRDDRFLAAVDYRGDRAFRLAYIVRAISPGVFHHPAASVEDMYRPAFRARTEPGRVTVTE